MKSKLSDMNKRIEKVNTLKNQINNQIDTEIQKCSKYLFLLLQNNDNTNDEYQEDLIRYCNNISICNTLRSIINLPETFMIYEAKYPDLDTIVYTISDMHIDMWLEYRCFVTHIIDTFGLSIINIRERDFEYKFANVLEDCLYEKSTKTKKIKGE